MIRQLVMAGTRRSLFLCAAGALLGLAMAGIGLFTARGTRTARIPAEYVATVNGVPILRSDFNAQLRSVDDVSPSQATAAQKRKLLEDMIREELYIQRGVELGLPTDDTETRTALLTATESLVAQNAIASVPTEAELRAYYQAHSERYATVGTMELKALTPSSQNIGDATRAVAALRQGMPLDVAVQRFGLVTSGKVDDGEEFYFAARIHLGDRAFAIARGLRAGDVAGPIPDQDGPILLVMLRNHAPEPQPYDAVRPRVADDLLAANIAKITKANDRFLRKRADLSIATDLQ